MSDEFATQPWHGIHVVDTGFHRPRFDAAYLIAEEGRGAFVDCGTNHSMPALLEAAAAAGLAPDAIDWLILTHVHLDHAGGAGLLMRQLPNARLLVHARGAPHMIDPSKLIAGATAVYGEAEIARSYGQIVPVPAERVIVATSDHTFELAGRRLRCIDTPGHARHHHCLWDERSRSWFTGDTFGISYRELDTAAGPFVFPTSTPVQFEPEALKASIARLLAFEPEAMHLTHYGRVTGAARLARDLSEQIDEMVAMAQDAPAGVERHAALTQALGNALVQRARKHGCTLDEPALRDVIAMDVELNAQGLGVWLDRAATA